MNRSIFVTAAVAALTLVLATTAFAQFESSDRSPFGVGLSVFRPSGSELRAMDPNWIGATLSWNARFDDLDRPRATVSIGWFSQDSSTAAARVVPITASLIKRIGEEESCWYYGGGINVCFAHFERYEFTPPYYSYSRVSDNGTKLGCNLLFGREFSGGWYVEFKKDVVRALSHKTGGSIDFSGWSVTLGSRLAY